MSQTESSRNYWRSNLFSTLTLFSLTTGMLQSIMLDLCWWSPNLSSNLKCRHIVSVRQNFTTLLDLPRIIAFPDLTNWIYSPAERIWSLPKFPQPFPTSLNGETQGTFIQRQTSSDHSFSSNNEGSPPFRCGRAASQIYPCDVHRWPYINPTLWLCLIPC